MTAKDLHFSFDSPLAQAAPTRSTQNGATGLDRPAANPGNPPRLAAKRTRRPRTGGTGEASARRAWITASLVSLINMAFLVVAALWLTGNTYDIPGFERVVPAAAVVQPATGVEDLAAALDASSRQITELRAAVAEQSEMLLAIQAQLARPQQPATQPTATAVQAPPVEDSVAVSDDWQINLGSFPSAAGAAKLQAELASMGYTAQVRGPDTQGEVAYNVWLGGYENREAADTVADYERFAQRYGMRRTNPAFWAEADWYHQRFSEAEPVEHGILDLNRYRNL